MFAAAKCEQVRCEFYSICEDDGQGGTKCVCPTGCVQVVSDLISPVSMLKAHIVAVYDTKLE